MGGLRIRQLQLPCLRQARAEKRVVWKKGHGKKMAEKKSTLQQAAQSVDRFMDKVTGGHWPSYQTAAKSAHSVGLKIKKLKHPKARGAAETIRSSLEMLSAGVRGKKAP